MRNDQSFLVLLSTFAHMVDVDSMGDEKALQRLLELLERRDPFILLTKDGPAFYAIAQRFGLVKPFSGRERLEPVNPELVCRALVDFEKWRMSVLKFEQASELITGLNVDNENQRRSV